jgi:TPR repeat protein
MRDLGATRAWFKRAAEAGHALAGYKQAAILKTVRGGPEDLAEARRLYALAAEQGAVEAQYNFAVMLQDGSGGPVDLAKARNLFENAARGGIDISFLHLAVLNTRGEDADFVEALKWTILANAANVDGALDYIKALRPLLSAPQKEQAKARSRNWK